MFGLFLGSLICVAGIQVLVMKKSQLSLEEGLGEEYDASELTNYVQLLDTAGDNQHKVYQVKLIEIFTTKAINEATESKVGETGEIS